MSNWISSKLRVAETFLQQIDQQAAESLNKNEKLQSDNELNLETPSSKVETIVPLKDQFKKRTTIPENNDFQKRDRNSELRTTPGKLSLNSTPTTQTQTQTPSLAQPPTTTTNTTLTDSDWTELLSTPKQATPSSANSNGISLMRSSRKDVKKLLEVKKKQSNNVNSFSKGTRRREIPLESSSNGGASSSKGSDGEESGSGDSVHRKSGVGSLSDESSVGEREKVGGLQLTDGSSIIEKGSLLSTVDDGLAEIKTHVDDHSDGFRIDKSDAAAVRSSVPIDSRRDSSSPSDDRSGSETGSTSSSDSEDEHKRRAERTRRREKILTEKAAAKAVEAIKERENVVARLEGEKQSLEKILEERAKQQAQEASDMQMSMMETMEAVDVEKQKHNTTRMEALTRLTKLETQNTDLARSLATTQWNLGVEANRVTELRQQLELKEGVHGDLRRRISKIQQSGSSSNQLGAARGAEFEREMLEAEYSFTCDKIEKLNEKAKKLEENIKITRNEMENPTAVEVELKRRLSQLTDHLIQKQAQVESLSSEKATMLLRIETVSRMLDDEKSNQQLSDMSGSSANDLEAGTWETSNSKLKPMFADRIRSGSQRFGSFLLQLDALFSAGAAYLRRNPPAKLCALVYIVLLHFWVAYILMSNSQASETRSGAIVSLESINKTTGSWVYELVCSYNLFFSFFSSFHFFGLSQLF